VLVLVHTVDRFASIVGVVLRLHARLAAVAELAQVNAVNRHLALAVLPFLLFCQAGEADILDELILRTWSVK
jgi:hypothetical protein